MHSSGKRLSRLPNHLLDRIAQDVLEHIKSLGVFDEMRMKLLAQFENCREFKSIEEEYRIEIDHFCSSADLNLPRAQLRERLNDDTLSRSSSKLRRFLRQTLREHKHELVRVYNEHAIEYIRSKYKVSKPDRPEAPKDFPEKPSGPTKSQPESEIEPNTYTSPSTVTTHYINEQSTDLLEQQLQKPVIQNECAPECCPPRSADSTSSALTLDSGFSSEISPIQIAALNEIPLPPNDDDDLCDLDIASILESKLESAESDELPASDPGRAREAARARVDQAEATPIGGRSAELEAHDIKRERNRKKKQKYKQRTRENQHQAIRRYRSPVHDRQPSPPRPRSSRSTNRSRPNGRSSGFKGRKFRQRDRDRARRVAHSARSDRSSSRNGWGRSRDGSPNNQRRIQSKDSARVQSGRSD